MDSIISTSQNYTEILNKMTDMFQGYSEQDIRQFVDKLSFKQNNIIYLLTKEEDLSDNLKLLHFLCKKNILLMKNLLNIENPYDDHYMYYHISELINKIVNNLEKLLLRIYESGYQIDNDDIYILQYYIRSRKLLEKIYTQYLNNKFDSFSFEDMIDGYIDKNNQTNLENFFMNIKNLNEKYF